MRVYLTDSDLRTDIGRQLLELVTRIAGDGTLDLPEIKELRRWLRANDAGTNVAAVRYLHDIMTRITEDGHVDRDELMELHLAIERVVPVALRVPITQARKRRAAQRREQRREAARTARDRETDTLRKTRAIETSRRLRMRHVLARVAGVTFPNEDGSERQAILRRCQPGEQLVLRHDPHNRYSEFATEVLRLNGEQLGHAPEHLAQRICDEVANGFRPIGVLTDLTGGSKDKPTRGANFAVFFISTDVTNEELQRYAEKALAAR
jgi:hypothetical protein